MRLVCSLLGTWLSTSRTTLGGEDARPREVPLDLRERVGRPDGERHPWELARLAFFERLAQAEVPDPSCFLDIGAGDAWLADRLLRRFPAARGIAWDINYTDGDLEALGRLRAVELTRDPPSDRADVVLLLDVIEHVEDDVGLLGESLSRVSPGGRMFVSVPAWPRLLSSHDEHLGHFRRYTPESLRAAITVAGGRSLVGGALFHGLLGLRAAQVMVERRRRGSVAAPPGVGQWGGGPLVTRTITAGLKAEGLAGLWCARRGIQPPGLSAWCIVEPA